MTSLVIRSEDDSVSTFLGPLSVVHKQAIIGRAEQSYRSGDMDLITCSHPILSRTLVHPGNLVTIPKTRISLRCLLNNISRLCVKILILVLDFP